MWCTVSVKDIVGLKYFDQLGALLEQLHDVGCERDRAGNRLGEKLQPLGADKRLADIKGLTLVDGSIVEALPRIAMASLAKKQSGSSAKLKWTLHSFFEVDRHVPTRIKVTPTGGGDCDERAVMSCELQPDRTYVMDRGYAKFELFNEIVDAKSSYVCRIRDNSVFTVVEERPLTDADKAARVLSDEVISLGSGSGKSRLSHPVRLVVVEAKPHLSKGRSNAGSTGRKPTLRTHEMICWYFCGMADDDELLAHLNGLKNQN